MYASVPLNILLLLFTLKTLTLTLTRPQVPLTPIDSLKALDQMEAAYSTLLNRPVQGGVSSAYKSSTAKFAKDGKGGMHRGRMIMRQVALEPACMPTSIRERSSVSS